MLLRHGTINPVLSLYSFLQPSCFLDLVPCRHHQAQLWLPNVHLYDLSMTGFSVGFAVPASQVRLPPSDPSPGPENLASEWHHLRIP